MEIVMAAKKPALGVLRARVANLVAFAESAEQAERAEAVIQELSTQNPVRSVLVLADKSVPDGQLSAALQIYCRPMRNRQLCFEQIRITAGAGQVPHLPGAVTQLLVRDLPNVLWWMGKPLLDLPEVEAMAEIADLLIFDSAECDPELEGFGP